MVLRQYASFNVFRWPGARTALLLALTGLLAFAVGFVCFDSKTSEMLVRRVGYSWMLALVSAWAAAVIALVRAEPDLVRKLWPGWKAATVILCVTAWILRMDPFGYKVLYDEPVQVATSLTLHQERELGAVRRAFSPNGVFTILNTHLDKRPPLFPFLVSIVHDLTGYRRTNAHVVNVAGTLALVYLAWHLGRRIGRSSKAGYWMLGLLATLPTLGVTATSAGMDLINLTLIALLSVAGFLYVERPSSERLLLLFATALLLAYARYESVLYVVSAGILWLSVCWRERRWNVPPAVLLVPLALILYGWHNTVVSNSPVLWELRENQAERFSFDYVANNLRHAGRFLFSVNRMLPNSLLLSVTGLAGGAVVLWQLLRRRAHMGGGTLVVLVAIGTGVLVNFGLLMFYYWGELDDPIVCRLSLPLHLFFGMLAVAGWNELRAIQKKWTSWQVPLAVTAATFLVVTVPIVGPHRYTDFDLLCDNLTWERRVFSSFWPKPGLVISNRSPVVWLADGIPALSFEHAVGREDALQWHLERHSFGTVLVMQRILTGGRDGQWIVDPGQQVPDHWVLKEVDVRRFGATLTRISVLERIDKPPQNTAEHVSRVAANRITLR